LYIDVDGVLLKPAFGDGGLPVQTAADGLDEFLDWAVRTFDCYWLTAWAIGGDARKIRRGLIPRLPLAARRIKLARWTRLKTDAFRSGAFLWIDDELYAGEREFLKKRGWMSRFVKVDPLERSLAPVREALESRARKLLTERTESE
jgi:hypothetical protein